MTAVLNERERKAATLVRELSQLGATVTTVLPLADGQHLRFWVSDYKKREVLTALADAGYEANFLGMIMQPDVATYSMGLVNSFEVPIARERQLIIDDRTIRGEIAKPAKTDVELQGMRRYLGLGPKK